MYVNFRRYFFIENYQLQFSRKFCFMVIRNLNLELLQIPAHEYDINSVAFADRTSHIIYSGGDDGLVKVWDRRTLSEAVPKPVGVLAGHMDGITFIDSRYDGRHLISNSKDQSIKLWDIRVFSDETAAKNTLRAVHKQTWDYRWQEVPPECKHFCRMGNVKRLYFFLQCTVPNIKWKEILL